MENNKILEVKDLKISFSTDHGTVHAVRGVSFDLYKGETLCIVGESGSGKSVTSKTIMGILSANATIEEGSILYEGEDLVRVSEEDFHRIRGHKIGMIFQDPLSSLNPIMKIGKQIIEATLINSDVLKKKFNELISKELIAMRNHTVSKDYCLHQLDHQVELLKDSITKDFKKSLPKNAQSHVLEEKLKNYILLTKEENNKILKEKSAQLKLSKQEIKNNGMSNDASTNIEPSELRKSLNESLNNEIIKRRHEINELNKKFKEVNAPIISKLKLEYKKQLKEEVETLKKENSLKKKDIIKKYKEEHPPLVKALKERKKEAKLEIKLYHESLKEKLNESLKPLNLKLQELKDEKKTSNDLEALDLKIKQVEKQIEEVKEDYIANTKITKQEAKRRALEVMKEVGIPLPERRFKQYPFEFSGGMRQRIVIAIALTADPDILICDEPTTALDVTIQAQILELINRLKRERNLSVIFITHDLGVVANMADRVAVMYAGKIVEYGTADEIFYDPRHPYTWALLSSIPDVDSKERLEAIPGTPPNMIYPPKGDAFAIRSKYAMAIDFKVEPPYFKVTDTHFAATWLLDPRAPKVAMPVIVSTRIKNSLAKHAKEAQKSKEENK